VCKVAAIGMFNFMNFERTSRYCDRREMESASAPKMEKHKHVSYPVMLSLLWTSPPPQRLDAQLEAWQPYHFTDTIDKFKVTPSLTKVSFLF